MSLAATCVSSAVRALNLGGRTLERVGVHAPSLDADSLRRAAMRRAGGLDDFGAWPIDEPLARLLESYRDEAALTLIGRITARELVVSLLENLLLLEAKRKANPAVEQERIEQPVFIVGLPRTGSTLLHGLVSQDPANRAPATWEVMYPAADAADAREVARARARTDARLAWANRLAPEFVRIHPIGADLPQECIAIQAQVFASIQFHTTHDVPSYEDWFEREGQALSYDFHYRFLQHLQAQDTRNRWVLKAPGHLFGLGALLARYPDARIVQTHRDPLRVMASMASHATVLRRAFSDAADPRRIAADWTERWSRALETSLDVRAAARPEQFLDVGYGDLVREPLAVVERVYAYLGWTLSDETRARMQAFLASNPKDKHGAHRYTLEQFGLDGDRLAARFRGYCAQFAIPVRQG